MGFGGAQAKNNVRNILAVEWTAIACAIQYVNTQRPPWLTRTHRALGSGLYTDPRNSFKLKTSKLTLGKHAISTCPIYFSHVIECNGSDSQHRIHRKTFDDHQGRIFVG
jgi:hypothetical protein